MRYKIHKIHALLHEINEEWDSIINGFTTLEEAEEYLTKENFRKSFDSMWYLNSYGIFTTATIKGKEDRAQDRIFAVAMEEASSVLGANPAYFGEEGTEEVERQLAKFGWSLEKLRAMNKEEE